MDGPERTPDGHFVVIDGRRWRATDPEVPERLAAELRSELMAARRAVRDAGDDDATAAARARVQDAKVALGERGEPWWEEPSDAGLAERVRAAMRALLRHRDPESTICPSDAARVAGGLRWRAVVPVAQEQAAALHAEDVVEVRQKGRRVDPGDVRGPVRIARGTAF